MELLAQSVVTVTTVVTRKTGDVVMHKHSVTDVKVADFASFFGDYSRWFVPQNKWSARLQIPVHQV
jgi:hypothetical protein